MSDKQATTPVVSIKPRVGERLRYYVAFLKDRAAKMDEPEDNLTELMTEAALLIEQLQSKLSESSANHAHDWQPDGGVLRFESHPGGEAAHVHTTCAKCGARAWFLEYQWELLAKGCA